jgi:hypothetical protein
MKGKQKQSLERREMDRGDEFVVELLYIENGEDEARRNELAGPKINQLKVIDQTMRPQKRREGRTQVQTSMLICQS